MNIDYDIKLDFDDVLLVPQRSANHDSDSRSNISLSKRYLFHNSTREWNGIPIIAANMDTVGTVEMSSALAKENCVTCLHKHYDQSVIANTIHSVGDRNVWMSIGVGQKDIEKLNIVMDRLQSPPNICIDVANGYSEKFVETCSNIRKLVGFNPIIMAGNVCTPNMVQELILHGGVDIVKVGIGPGSACTTRLKTGVGYPQLSAIAECSHAAHGLKSKDKHHGLVCADGGCRTPSDVVKAFAAGADFVMLGGMLAGTDECEGDWEYAITKIPSKGDSFSYTLDKKKKRLLFYGMSSSTAQEKHGGVKEYRSSEGRERFVNYKGPASDIIKDIKGGLRSACTYTGANCLKDLPKTAEFIRVNRTHFDQTV